MRNSKFENNIYYIYDAIAINMMGNEFKIIIREDYSS